MERSEERSSAAPVAIDVHAHVLDPYVLKLAANRNVATNFGARGRGEKAPNVGDMIDAGRQVEVMDERRIDRHVISSPCIIQGTGWASPQTDLELCRRVNDTIAGWVARYPTRFIGSFVLPLQDMYLALREMDRAVGELRLKVANLPANVQGIYLGDIRLEPFWEKASAHGVVAFVHPDGVKDPWFQNFGLWNSLGQSIEEARVMASLIYEGTLDRFPDVKIVMAHGGGYFPHYMGRLDRNTTNLPQSMQNISQPPSTYLRRFYYDTCVYDPDVLRRLAAIVGTDRLVMGSDFSVNMGHPRTFLEDCKTFSEAELAQIAGLTAAGLFS